MICTGMSVLLILFADHTNQIFRYPAIPVRLGLSLLPFAYDHCIDQISVLIKFCDFTFFFFIFSYHLGYKWAASTEQHLAIIAEIGLVFLFEKWSDIILSC